LLVSPAANFDQCGTRTCKNLKFLPTQRVMRAESMFIIHFTRAATDALTIFGALGANFLPLADGHGDTHIS
jgi:hypothetical protein